MSALAGLFLHPGIALAAALSVALPIAIHFLFRRRRVPIDWGAMELLREAVRRTNRRLRLEQWVVLALRSLLVLLAGLAVAAPFVGDALAAMRGEKTWVVVVDDGVTSGLRVGSETELARVRDEAMALVAGRAAGDRVAIVRAAAPARLVLAPTADEAALREALEAVAPRETPSDLAAALAIARETVAAEARGGTIVVASGFRRASLAGLETVAAGDAEGDAEGGAEDGGSGRPSNGASSGFSSGVSSGASNGDAVAAARGAVEIVAVAPAQEFPVDVRVLETEARVLPGGDTVSLRVRLGREGGSLEAGRSTVRAQGDGLRASGAREIEWSAGQAEATLEFQLVPDALSESMNGGAAGPDARRRRGVTVEVAPGDRAVRGDGADVASSGDAAGSQDGARPRGVAGDPLAAGDRGYAVLEARREIEVVVVGRRGALDAADLDRVPSSLWVSRALAPGVGSGMRVREADPSSVDGRALLGVDAVVVARPDLLSPAACGELGAFAGRGGVVVVLPAGESRAQGWGGVLLPALGVGMRVASEASDRSPPVLLAEEQPASRLLASIRPELPGLVAPVEVARAVAIEGVSDADVVLRLADGSAWMVVERLVVRMADRAAGSSGEGREGGAVDAEFATGAGVVVLLGSAPELAWTNLPVKPLMVPLVQESVRAALEWAAASMRAEVGARLVASGASRVVRDGSDGTAPTGAGPASLAVDASGRTTDVVASAGIWRGDDGSVHAVGIAPRSIALAPGDGESVRAALARFGEVRVMAAGAGAGADGGASDGARPRAAALDAWAFPLFVAALVVLLLEGVLSRAFSHASLARAGRMDAGIAVDGASPRRGLVARGGERDGRVARAGRGTQTVGGGAR